MENIFLNKNLSNLTPQQDRLFYPEPRKNKFLNPLLTYSTTYTYGKNMHTGKAASTKSERLLLFHISPGFRVKTHKIYWPVWHYS